MKRHNRYTITTALHRSNSFVMRAAEVLYKRQTIDERASGMSVHINVLGFNRADSETMTAIVEAWLTTNEVCHESVEIARQRCLKYSRQLTDHANGNHVDLALAGWEALDR